MPYYICKTCGVQHAQTVNPPNSCLICDDERQYIHPDGQSWTTLEDMREKENLQNILKSGETLNMKPGLDLYRLGGHFKGGAVLHWSNGNEGKGCLLTGDVITVAADRNWVSFMYSYPNLIPLPASKVEEIAAKVKPLQFNRIYNAFSKVVRENAGEAVQHSAVRYIKALNSELFHT
ncbi:hydrolase [Bacillus spizizenii]|uniref:hydrolase n=1 Tax=Bacillus spizizenii TaxID=96241 RepID=UPI002DB98A5A|nr:hydrolase [Bacillus spizizenii]MEC2181255.1 hydrolase [Bacillus spizizenii]